MSDDIGPRRFKNTPLLFAVDSNAMPGKVRCSFVTFTEVIMDIPTFVADTDLRTIDKCSPEVMLFLRLFTKEEFDANWAKNEQQSTDTEQ